MFLIQVLVPLFDPQGKQFGKSIFNDIREGFLKKFGGVTIYASSIAEGLWKDDLGKVDHDQLIVFEVMTESLNRKWWKNYRQKLEQSLLQDEIVIRVVEFTKL